MPKTTSSDRPELNPVNVGAAAIDIGSKMHVAAVNPACTDMPVRAFGTFTQDLHDLADWFKACDPVTGTLRHLLGQDTRLRSQGGIPDGGADWQRSQAYWQTLQTAGEDQASQRTIF